MDDTLTEKIRALLADPQAVERIAAIAGTLGASPGNSGQPPQPEPPPTPQPAPMLTSSQPAFAPQQGHPPDPRLDLLRALRPLVAEEKQGRLEDLLRIATVASLLGNLKR